MLRGRVLILSVLVFATALFSRGNIPGGGTGSGANVTLVNSGNGTVTIGNGIVSIICNTNSAVVSTINYTFNNSGSVQTLNLLSGNSNGGKLYWEHSNNQGLAFSYGIVANPANNGGNYAEIVLSSTTVANMLMEVHYSMSRGSTGFYVTPIFIHGSTDGAASLGECRDNIYAGSIFNWMSVDAARNRRMEVSTSASAMGVPGAPAEVSLWTNGIYAGRYEDKYKYGADFGVQRVWGWSSVGTGGKNIGLWSVSGSAEYYNGGPMKRELMEHIGTTILNMINGGHYGSLGQDASWAAGEVWSKVCGPYFIYCNNITNTITATNQAAQSLYADALAQAAAEASAWPYGWFTNAYYAGPAGRGVVTGQMAISDSYNPNASASNLWVGVVQQPSTVNSIYDFQLWVKPYQFWVKTDSNGVFKIPGVIAGGNYTLYAFGPGAPGTFQSQSLSGGRTPNTIDIPASPFSVTVVAGATNDLGTVTWTPTRVGPTAFEIGFPNRTGDKFKHGEDWWVGDIGPGSNAPSPVWSKWLELPFDYPGGLNYVVGQSRWTTDWNFCQPVVTDSAGNYNGSTSTITFNLPSAPSGTASFYMALSSDYQGPLIIQVNGNNIAGSTGYFPNYSSSGSGSDATIREGIHGTFSDNRINFSAGLLRAGQNTITINMRKGGYFANHAMYDYIRLEVPNYIPPAPASVSVYAGNNCNLVCWPVQPGATSYNILRSTTSGGGYVSVTNGVAGPACGSGWNNATYLDTSAVNGTTYYYVVQAVNPIGASANSLQSSAVTPDAGISVNAPPTPTSVTIGGSGHQSVTLNWGASPGANFYTVYRSTLFDNGGGASNVLGTVVLANNVTGTTYTDHSPTDGSTYSYFVTATGTGGTSGNSSAVAVIPLPSPPGNAPTPVTQTAATTNSVTFGWPPVPGAVGYIIRYATKPGGPFAFQASITETTYLDSGVNPGSNYYQIAAMNAGGVSTNVTLAAVTVPAAPATITAIPGTGKVSLSWSSPAGASNYVVSRSTTSGGPYTTVGSTSNTSYLNVGLANGVTYYYVVSSANSFGTGPQSVQVSATTIVQPSFSGVALSNGSVVFSGSGGLGNGAFYLLGSTNLSEPGTNWVPLLTNQFDSLGNFNITNPMGTNVQEFYRLQMQ